MLAVWLCAHEIALKLPILSSMGDRSLPFVGSSWDDAAREGPRVMVARIGRARSVAFHVSRHGIKSLWCRQVACTSVLSTPCSTNSSRRHCHPQGRKPNHVTSTCTLLATSTFQPQQPQ